ncbi:hypothetical protein ACHWGL_31915, partial [Klebsiella pneumoniae]|uniref:hypothetical protein n=1 Tax=Klebsiella pneumoniae TaxID=573 RepID=UPI00376EEB58
MRHLAFTSAIAPDFERAQKRCARVPSRDGVNECVVASMRARICIIVGHRIASCERSAGQRKRIADHPLCDADAVMRDV